MSAIQDKHYDEIKEEERERLGLNKPMWGWIVVICFFLALYVATCVILGLRMAENK